MRNTALLLIISFLTLVASVFAQVSDQAHPGKKKFSLTPVADAVAKRKDYSQWFLSNGSHHTHGLEAWYPFNGSADDASGNENHGKVYGASLVKDRFEEDQAAYFFDGKEDWIDLKKCIIKRNLTLSLWCKLDLNQLHRGHNGAFVIYSAYWGDRYGGLICFYHPKRMGGSIEYRFNGGLAHPNTNIWVDNPQGDISFNTWNNFVITHQDGHASAYCNSKLYSSGSVDHFSVPESYPPFTKNIGETIARGSWYDGVAHLTGTIDDIRIYNYALSANQLVSLYELEK